MVPTRKGLKKGTAKKAIVVSKKVKDYGNDPFFVKKAKAMQAILKKHGLPASVAKS